ncbi:NAD(P)-dependent dehydrogenase (short-subunit alcohol dehydrogenase family) [Pontibacter ummariensis]|uniref:NAD(P)-dependent dehydrogenase, short-chain alcohol dehydrogenase family n=1 Tax=Pontibacter ummariensis TaxID=1610492 RepID=A0A239E1T7_9BACT|nr:glucose 1-dehydrogenase [Pontibacter ummariensis]PRY13666.1 NAD(P)-dependent dehydrogenase (short-subunit alcohol dehydrogenase family) [Pontibacter ummariensis]SNS37953.1 NAD(P)-dependent dehydrogenase, short-chain alcohol dehydrogenase family [Pontibacter ummariensis]
MKIDLKDKVALVTGGSKGIGRGAAEALAAAGATVVICARNKEELQATAKEIAESTGSKVIAVPADVAKQEDVDRLVQRIKQEAGEVDILVNNAGTVGAMGDFEDIDPDAYLSLYDLNVVSMVRLIQAVLPAMKSSKWGRIINISSENGLQPYPDMIPYDLTKAAIINLSKGVSKALGKYNILVNTVSPAFITTPLVENMMQEQAEKSGTSKEKAVQNFLKKNRPDIVLERPGTIAEVGAAVVFLASEQASFITGTNLRVDGGSVASI